MPKTYDNITVDFFLIIELICLQISNKLGQDILRYQTFLFG